MIKKLSAMKNTRKVVIFLICGVTLAVTLYGVNYWGYSLRQQSTATWLSEAKYETRRITDISFNWLSMFTTQLRGINALLIGSEVVTEDEFLAALEITLDTERKAVTPLVTMAYAEFFRSPQKDGGEYQKNGDCIITLSSETSGPLAVGMNLANHLAIRETISLAFANTKEVVLGPTFQDEHGQVYTTLATQSQNNGNTGFLFSVLNLNTFISELRSLYVPDGLNLRGIEIGGASGKDHSKTLLHTEKLSTDTVAPFHIPIKDGHTQWNYYWDVFPHYHDGPSTLSGIVVQFAGSTLVLMVFSTIVSLVQRNRRVQKLVADRTAELHVANAQLTIELTERKQAEREASLMSSALNNMQESAFLINEKARFLYVNEKACSTLGYTREELLELTISDIDPNFPPEYWPTHWAELKASGSILFEGQHKTKDGQILTVEINANYLEYEDHRYNIAMVRDISERKQAEEKIHQLVNYQSAILDNAGYMVIVATEEGIITVFNPAAERALGYTAEECVGKLTPAIIHDPKEVAERAQQFSTELGISIQPGFEVFVAKARDNIFNEHEWTYIRKDGSRFPVMLSVTALRDSQQNIIGFMGIANDISGQKQAEDAIRKLNEELEIRVQKRTAELTQANSQLKEEIVERQKVQAERDAVEIQLRNAQKLEAVGQLAAGIAHEINTPTQYVGDNIRFIQESFESMTDILCNYKKLLKVAREKRIALKTVTLVEESLEANDADYLCEEVPVAIKETLKGIERISRIVLAMKEFSHPGKKELELADLNKAIETTITVARNEWKYVADLHLHLNPDLPLIPCFLGEFNQCMLNLVVNAAHAIGNTVNASRGIKGKITISTHCNGSYTEVRVKDTGMGIPETVQPHVFDPFFTTKDIGEGTGQGLTIVYNTIVQKHGGTVSFETEQGQGTTFILRLPVHSTPESDTNKQKSDEQS